MDLILADASGAEECVLDYDFDMDIGKTNDFEISLSYGTWDDRLQMGKRVYIPDTEYGGIIKRIDTSTNTEEIKLKGYLWRGYLMKRIVIPSSGADYFYGTGDLNEVIGQIVSIPGFWGADNCGRSVSGYKFNRYVDAASSLQKMCESVGYRLDIKYKQTDTSGYVLVQAVRAKNYGETVEYSQDSMIDFSSVDNQMGVNHLICLGKGELRDRIVIHLYADKDGNISRTQTLTGINEIVETFENSGAEEETLIETGTKKLQELRNSRSFTPKIRDTELELFLGDIVSGRDYITGNAATKPIAEKIVKRSNGELSIDYKIEGES